ncbi:MAG TPA: hypothetical protein VFA15_03345, partial [Nitrososphaera sp.]|nr:hypothetical protein [Nitrososphaera sp.]
GSRVILIALSVLCTVSGISLTSAPPAMAQDGTAASLEQRKTLEGHLQSEASNLETGLKGLDKTLHHLKRGAYDVFTEVFRQDYAVVGQPDVIGPIVIPAMPSPSGILPVGGYLPPRKKWLDYFMSEINSLQTMCQADVSGLVLPDDASDTAKSELQSIKSSVSLLPKDVQDLAALTQGPKYDNNAIGRQAQLLQDHVSEMQKSVKKLYEACKKASKLHEKHEKDLEKQIKKEQK